MKRRIVVGITGASGVIYGVEMLRELGKKPDMETHLIISESGKKNIALETDYSVEQVEALADEVYGNDDLSAPPASGSFITYGLIVAPLYHKDTLRHCQFLFRHSHSQSR